MSKEDVINYVMTTPGNPNKAVLSGMLDSIAQSGGTVEVIKIASGTMGGSGDGNLYWLNGGFTIDGDKTLDEIINGKTIVNVALSVDEKPASFTGPVYFRGFGVYALSTEEIEPNYNGQKELILAQYDDGYINSKTISVFATAGTANNPSGITVSVYAICI